MKNKYKSWELTQDDLETIQILFETEIDNARDLIKQDGSISSSLRWLADLIDIKDKIDYQIEHYGK